MSVQAHWLTSLDELRTLGPQYDAMVLASGDAGCFYQLGWLERVWPYYRDRLSGTLAFLIAEQTGTPVALAPLVLTTRGWAHARQRVLGFIGGTWDELDNWMPRFLVAARDPAQRAMLTGILADAIEQKEGWDLLDLRLARSDCPSRTALQLCFPPLAARQYPHSTPRANLQHGWDAYWSGRSKRLLRMLERGRKRIVEDGLSLNLEVTQGVPLERRADAEAIHLARQDSIRAEGRPRSSPFEDAAARALFWSLVDWATAHRRLRTYWLRTGDRMVAYVIALHHAGTTFAYFNAIDPAAERYHPGSLVLAEMVRLEAAQHGATVIDLMFGANLTKTLFATEELTHTHLSVVNEAQLSSRLKAGWIRAAKATATLIRR